MTDTLRQDLEAISKKYGVTVSQIKDIDGTEVEVIPSGSYTIDDALGIGGYPRGRIIEIFGKESGGKTTLSLLAIAEAQKAGGTAAFIDMEHSLSLSWAQKLGVKTDELIFVQPDYGEQALAVVEDLVKSDKVDMIVVDSVASLVPKAELEGELGDPNMAQQARMLSQILRRLVPVVGKSKTVLIFINQVRDGINPYGPKETTPGGRALKFNASVRLSVKVQSQSQIKEGEAVLGHRVEISVVKNKVGAPFLHAEFTLRFLSGVDRVDELATMGVTRGIVKQGGSSFSFGPLSERGFDKFVNALREDEASQKAIWTAIRTPKSK